MLQSRQNIFTAFVYCSREPLFFTSSHTIYKTCVVNSLEAFIRIHQGAVGGGGWS